MAPVLSFKAENINKEQFEYLNKDIHEDYKVGNPTDTSGTIQDHAATVDYKYDEDSKVVNFDIQKVHRGFFEKVDPVHVKDKILKFVDEVLGRDEAPEEDPETEQGATILTADLDKRGDTGSLTGGQFVRESNASFKAPEPITPAGENISPADNPTTQPAVDNQADNSPSSTRPFQPKVATKTDTTTDNQTSTDAQTINS